MARFDTVEVGGSPMRICVAAPDGAGPHPSIIVMCHISGLDAFTEDRVDRLAAAGYVAAAPDIFHYHDWIEDRDKRRATLRDTRVLADIEAALAHIDSVESVDTNRTAILGHCMGGRTAMLGAGSISRFGPLVDYYGGNTMKSWGDDQGPTPFERIPSIKGPVIGFFGLLDSNPSPADVDRIEAEFGRAGIPCEFHRYEGADHAFQNFSNPERHHPKAAEESWDRTLRFLGETLA
jgi:carboxymethylenebutenolidase